jgi:hypothetical protein
MKRKLFTLAAILLALPMMAVCPQKGNSVPEFAQFWSLINSIYDGEWADKTTDPGTDMKRIVFENETDSEEGIDMTTIIYGRGVKAVKKQMEGYMDWVCEATDAHAYYARFHFDTDNGAIIAFKDKADADAFARQMQPLLQRDDTDLEYGSATIGYFYLAQVEPQQNDEGWWIFDFHAG